MSRLLSKKTENWSLLLKTLTAFFLCQFSKKNTTKCCVFYMFCVPLQRKRKFMALFCDSFCDEVCGVWGLRFLWPVLYHWAVNEGRLDEVSLLFLTMMGGELGADKSSLCITSIRFLTSTMRNLF